MSSEDFEGLREAKQTRHQSWNRLNRSTLTEAGHLWTREANQGAALLYRGLGKPFADFYPHTGRWKDCTTGKIHRGGAKAFLAWSLEHGLFCPILKTETS